METERILLRPWRDDDAPVLYRFASDPDVGPRAGWAAHTSVDESREVIRSVFMNPTTWAIVLKSNNLPIGAMGYGPSCDCGLPAFDDEPTVGYWVAKPYWGLGICTEALRMMIDHVRRTADMRSFVSGHFVDNPASCRVMEKCGFVPTGDICTSPTLVIGSDRPIRVLRLWL
ncbi:MAG: GNAT family N-acetyltransferase [Candidatus Limisoma sp.]